jgi:hypothetical protein
MQPALKSKSAWRPGTPNAIESESPSGTSAVVFEDDGEVGFLYAVDRSEQRRTLAGNRTYEIVDSLQIYDVKTIQPNPVIAEFIWSKDGLKVALKLNTKVQAVFDFSARQGWCLTGSPPPSDQPGKWTKSHMWDETALQLFAQP